MSGPIVHQLLLTRFNIRTSGVGYTEDQPPEWLDERIGLFARYCAPSINAQTQEDFDWIVFCDPRTPPADLNRICSFDPRIRIAFFATQEEIPDQRARRPPEVSAQTRLSPGDGTVLPTLRVFPHVRPGTEVVVATRLDNDDALSRHYLRRVRGLVDHFLETGHPQWLYNPMLGYKLDHETKLLFPLSKPNSPFLTMFERVSDVGRPAGPFSGNHSHMHEQYPTYLDDGAPLWLMVIHGGNVINRIGLRDRDVPIESLGDDFRISL
jgi:hypothetical protein